MRTLAFLLLLATAAQAQPSIEAGWGFGVPLGGTRNGNLVDSRLGLVEVESRTPVLFEYLKGAIGLQGLGVYAPYHGWGAFLYGGGRVQYSRFTARADAGAGYTDFDGARGQADKVMFLLQAGASVRVIEELELGTRIHHLSNAGLDAPNGGINSVVFSAGWAF